MNYLRLTGIRLKNVFEIEVLKVNIEIDYLDLIVKINLIVDFTVNNFVEEEKEDCQHYKVLLFHYLVLVSIF